MPITGWTYHRPLTDSNGTALANFACRVSLSSTNFNFANAKADGSDLRVRDETAGALVPMWLHDFDPVAQTGVLWFKATLTSNSHSIYCGNAAATSVSNFATVFTKGTGFDTDWGDLTTSVSSAGAATRLAAWSGALTSNRLFQLMKRSTVPQVATGDVVSRPCVREFAILTDPNGKIVQDGGVYVAYHIAQSTTDGVNFPGQTYRVTSTNLVTWGSRTLALAANVPANTHNDRGARVSTVIKMAAGDYRMWYTASGSVGTSGGVAYATSTDGLTFTDQGVIMTTATCGVTDVTPVLSGVPDVVQLLDGTWAMHNEVRSFLGSGYPWKVYGWTSPNVTGGGTWTILNGGASVIPQSNGLTTWGNANPHLWQRATGDNLLFSQAFSGTDGTLSNFNGNVGVWACSTLNGPYTLVNAVAGRINVSPSNFGTETSGLAFMPDGTPVWHIQDYPAPDNINSVSNVYRVYPVPQRLGLINTTAAADGALASMTVAAGNFTAENRGNLTAARSGDNTIYQLGLADSATALATDTSTNNIAKFRVAVRQSTFSGGQGTQPGATPGDITFLYWDASAVIHYYKGSTNAWTTTDTDVANTTTVDTLREVTFRIDDDGTNFILSSRYADDNTLIKSGSIAKSSVKAFSSGRALFTGIPFTNTNYGGAYSRRISVRSYAATEPAMSVGSQVQDAATWYTLSTPSPASGIVNIPSGLFSIVPNASYTGTITLTPSGGGLSTPMVFTFSSPAPQQFTITPTVAGTVTLTGSNSGGLLDPGSIAYTAAPATPQVSTTQIAAITYAFSSSRSGSMAYTVYDLAGSIVTARTTAGIAFIGNAFVAAVNVPWAGSFVVDWDDGTTHDAMLISETMVEPGTSDAQDQSAILAAVTGRTTGVGTTFYDPTGNFTRLTGTVVGGDRTTTTISPPS